jgi:TonB family protein
LRRTRLDGLSTRIKLDFDADGKVVDAVLLESTGNQNLDAAILKWARDVKLKPGSPGGPGVLPMTLLRPR